MKQHSKWLLCLTASLVTLNYYGREKLAEFSEDISQTLNTPVWYNGEDWAEDNVFMIYQMDVSNPGAYLKEFKKFFTEKWLKNLAYGENSFGLAVQFLAKNGDVSHFAWIGAADIKSSLSSTKKCCQIQVLLNFLKKYLVLER